MKSAWHIISVETETLNLPQLSPLSKIFGAQEAIILLYFIYAQNGVNFFKFSFFSSVLNQLSLNSVKFLIGEFKPEFGVQNQYGRVIYPSFGNFMCSKKNYTFRGRK
jgi:hypothetical protein